MLNRASTPGLTATPPAYSRVTSSTRHATSDRSSMVSAAAGSTFMVSLLTMREARVA